MIYIYFPNALFLLIWLFYFEYSVIFSLFLTPLAYLVINGYLIYKQKFNQFHSLLDNLIVFNYIETVIHSICNFIVYLLFKLPYVNHMYSILKVKILVYLFNLVVSYIPSQKVDPFTEELQNDYLTILNKNRRNRPVSPPVINDRAGNMD